MSWFTFCRVRRLGRNFLPRCSFRRKIIVVAVKLTGLYG